LINLRANKLSRISIKQSPTRVVGSRWDASACGGAVSGSHRQRELEGPVATFLPVFIR
jgi:hypothetical protein